MEPEYAVLAGNPLFKLVENLNYKDLKNLCSTDRRVRSYCDAQKLPLWRYMIRRDFPNRYDGIGLDILYRDNPEELYKLLLRKSQIFMVTPQQMPMTYARFPNQHEMYLKDPSDPRSYMELDEIYATDAAMVTLLSSEIKSLIGNGTLLIVPGDIIRLSWFEQYRNDGKFAWNGANIVLLGWSQDIDEYGYIPSSFSYPDYPTDHFEDSIEHNLVFWIREDLAKQLHKDFENGAITLEDEIMGTKAIIFFEFEDDEDEVTQEDVMKYFAKNNHINPEIEYNPNASVLSYKAFIY